MLHKRNIRHHHDDEVGAMWMDAYVEEILIRQRVAEAQREGARRQLLQGATRTRGHGRLCTLMHRVLDMTSTLWPTSRRVDHDRAAARSRAPRAPAARVGW